MTVLLPISMVGTPAGRPALAASSSLASRASAASAARSRQCILGPPASLAQGGPQLAANAASVAAVTAAAVGTAAAGWARPSGLSGRLKKHSRAATCSILGAASAVGVRRGATSLAATGVERENSLGEAAGPLDADGSAAVAMLESSIQQLQQLRQDWEALPAPEGARTAQQYVERFRSLRESLKTCSQGDPGESTTAPRRRSVDPVVAAHGDCTRAVIEVELAQAEWEIACSEALGHAQGSQQELAQLAGSLVSLSVLRLRLFDIENAHLILQRAMGMDVGTNVDPRLATLVRYCAVLAGPRHSEMLALEHELQAGSRGEALLCELKRRLLDIGYKTQEVLRVTKASSMSEFIFVESRVDKLERGLLESSEEPNPMKPELQQARASSELVDFIRIFLLHRPLPLARMSQLVGVETLALLLRLRAIQAIEGDGCKIIDPETAASSVERDPEGCGAYFAFSNVAMWPVEEDLLLCTDFEQTFSSEELEPVMYISEDSTALVCGASRIEANTVLDLCCGSGIQGIVALRHYAQRATFVDLNPRALRFTRFNAAFNGFAGRVDGLYHGSLYEALPHGAGPFDAITANPPFVPNPLGIASGAGAMFGDGGDTGEDVLAAIVRGAPRVLAAGGRLSTVSMAPNVNDMPARLQGWYSAGVAEVPDSPVACGFEGLVFQGTATEADRYQPTSTQAETTQYQASLRRMGVITLSEVVTVMKCGEVQGAQVSVAGEPRADLWSDHFFLRLVTQRSLTGSESPQAAEQAPATASSTPAPAPAQAPAPAPAAAAPPTTPATPPPPPKPTHQPAPAVQQAAPPTPPPPPKPARAAPQPAAPEPETPAPAPKPVQQPVASPVRRPLPAGTPDRQREGCLPGFQPGFFPASCATPSREWEPTAQELARVVDEREQQLIARGR